MKYIDLTHKFTDSMPSYPGDPRPILQQITLISEDGVNDHSLKTTMHIGTHIDAPAHMISNGKLISDYPIEKFFGKAIFIDARGQMTIGPEILPKEKIKAGNVVILYTGWDKKFGNHEYFGDHPIVNNEFADTLIELGISILCIDFPSPDKKPYPIHQKLLRHDILIAENATNLELLIEQKKIEIIALPLYIEADASPCRIVAKIG
ncbi:MAG: cyclase family protein [Candidatus Magasanikbacteria bacterium]|nr:cyclase family protein [Candidatus Magasanikbacteria bacterium]